MIDTSWAKDEIDGIRVDAVLYVNFTGMQGGVGITDVLLGRVNPSGKTNDTWAKDLTDYPSTAGWGEQRQAYTEDIFVGYRWFETFDPAYERVNYEFGFGLSYTEFLIETGAFTVNGDAVEAEAVVTNIGLVPGKEVVQLYVSAPQGVLGKAAKVLCDFGKTKTLAPGESQTVTLKTKLTDHPSFNPDGGYWCGGVWAPTSYMVLKGLDTYGRYALSHKIGLNYLQYVVSVYKDTGTLWENYAPMPGANGKPRQGGVSHANFVGWTGIVPISVLFEYVFGIKPDAANNVIRWNIDLTDRFGVENYPFGTDATLTLLCESRGSAAEEPQVEITADKPVTVEIYWNNGRNSKTVQVKGAR